MNRSSTQSVLLAGLLAAAFSSPTLGASSATGSMNVHGDFNGDGYTDLAIGVPQQKVGSVVWAGEVHILYGSAWGLSDLDQVLNQTTLGQTAGSYARFGSALATGDFDRDGYSDLAIGAPGYSIGSITSTGIVTIVYGSAAGLNTSRSWMFNQNTSGIADSCESYDAFGSSLATGDFNHDYYSDLLVGVPYEDLDGYSNAGAVHALYGSTSGLGSAYSQFWYQNSSIEGSTAANDRFGWAVAAGDFNGDYYDDAAIGVPGDLSSGAGAVNIILGSHSRLTPTGNNRFYRGDGNGVDNSPGYGSDDNDEFGSALAAGNFNGDGNDDLAIGAYGTWLWPEDTGGGGLTAYLEMAGSVTVLYGSTAGLNSSSSRADQCWTQGSSGIEGSPEANDWFGYALAAADFDGDGKDDLAVGVPGEAIGSVIAAGAVNVIYGSSDGLDDAGDQIWHQDTDGIEGSAEEDDWFGWALAVGDFNNDGKDDLAVGVPREKVDGVSQAGCINVIYGLPSSTVGLADAYNTLWHRNDSGIQGSAESSAQFGASLCSGR